ncbi:ribosome assembly factor SBDS [Candidatus Woesearchaeota archaeon]|nr:ribosome assembly factor SBDS [Candidatus Woesearchaeota archaeon]
MTKGDQLYKGERPSFNLAKLKLGGENFEIVVDADKAIDYKNGKQVEIRDVLQSEKIFSDAQKGMLASEHLLEKLFNTSDPAEVAKQIIKKGEIQLTAEYRERLREEKKRKIIHLIQRNGIDPRTELPHPPQRIENAIAEAKVRIDEHKRAEDQVQDVLKKIRTVLPIKFEVREIQVHITAKYAAKSYSLLKNYGTLLKDAWQNDGSLISVIELPAGMQQDFVSELSSLTHGEVEIKVLKAK